MSLYDELQKTLSFLEPMSLEMIFLDMDKEFLNLNPSLTTEDLLKELKKLEKQKKVKKSKIEGQFYWIRIYPKRPWYKKLFFIPFK